MRLFLQWVVISLMLLYSSPLAPAPQLTMPWQFWGMPCTETDVKEDTCHLVVLKKPRIRRK